MKKLSLKKLKLESNNILQRNQLKSVLGGYHDYWTVKCTFSDEDGDYWVASLVNAAYAGYYWLECYEQGGTPSKGHVFIGGY